MTEPCIVCDGAGCDDPEGCAYSCSQEPHPGAEFYGVGGGCAECGFTPKPPDLVLLLGGPYGMSMYTAKDWHVTREAERVMIDEGFEQRPKVLARYVETKEVAAPQNRPGQYGVVWRWSE